MTVSPRLEPLLVSEMSAFLDGLSVGAEFEVPSSADLCYSLELFLPAKLHDAYEEWAHESIDGFFVAHAKKTGPASAELAGTCILIRDQTVTPFQIDLHLSTTEVAVSAYRILVGEPGEGSLGISGPACNSKGALQLLGGLMRRIDSVQWVYEATSEPE